MKIERDRSAEYKARWKLVRTDDYVDIPGIPIEADEDTGEAEMQVGDATNRISLGVRGFLICRTGYR